jgi:glutamate-1-semialdehyde 2,1-aminomutase
MLTLFLGPRSVRNYDDAIACDTERFGRFFGELIAEGIWIPPSQFEAWFVSLAHSPGDLDRTVEAVHRALAATD